MTNLKTLKDIVVGEKTSIDMLREELRQEAIKWVKKTNEDISKDTITNETTIWLAGRKDGFIRFFNLTEEDLK